MTASPADRPPVGRAGMVGLAELFWLLLPWALGLGLLAVLGLIGLLLVEARRQGARTPDAKQEETYYDLSTPSGITKGCERDQIYVESPSPPTWHIGGTLVANCLPRSAAVCVAEMMEWSLVVFRSALKPFGSLFEEVRARCHPPAGPPLQIA